MSRGVRIHSCWDGSNDDGGEIRCTCDRWVGRDVADALVEDRAAAWRTFKKRDGTFLLSDREIVLVRPLHSRPWSRTISQTDIERGVYFPSNENDSVEHDSSASRAARLERKRQEFYRHLEGRAAWRSDVSRLADMENAREEIGRGFRVRVSEARPNRKTSPKRVCNAAVKAKIRKLLALASRGRNPSESEAAAALKKAQEMLFKYGLELADIQEEVLS